jgi:hypothetical protein
MQASCKSLTLAIIKKAYIRLLYIWNPDLLKIKTRVICKITSVLKFP